MDHWAAKARGIGRDSAPGTEGGGGRTFTTFVDCSTLFTIYLQHKELGKSLMLIVFKGVKSSVRLVSSD